VRFLCRTCAEWRPLQRRADLRSLHSGSSPPCFSSALAPEPASACFPKDRVRQGYGQPQSPVLLEQRAVAFGADLVRERRDNELDADGLPCHGACKTLARRLGDLLLRLLLRLHLRPPGPLGGRDPVPCGTAHPPRWLGRFGPLHLPLRPALLHQPRHFPPCSDAHPPRRLGRLGLRPPRTLGGGDPRPSGGAHAATPAGDSCRSRRTTYSAGFSRVYGLKCRDGLVDAIALRSKFCKNPIGDWELPAGGETAAAGCEYTSSKPGHGPESSKNPKPGNPKNPPSNTPKSPRPQNRQNGEARWGTSGQKKLSVTKKARSRTAVVRTLRQFLNCLPGCCEMEDDVKPCV